MERGPATTTSGHNTCLADSDDRIVEQRLAELLRLNVEIANEKTLFRSDDERFRASLMTRPIDSRKAFAYFGLMIGSLPPFALVLKMLSETTGAGSVPILFSALLIAAGIATGAAGYVSGRLVPSAIRRVERFSLPNRIALLSSIGFLWGAISGVIGGVFLFIIGALFAGISGGVIGAVALPIFAGFHSMLRAGDFIELKHFLPVAVGITFSLCAFILGS